MCSGRRWFGARAVGVVGAIVPWNVPLFVTMLKLAPALASGSTVVLKPAPETPLDAYLLAEAVQEAGLPAGVLNIVQAGREVGEHIVTHPDVDKIWFTGSTAAGKKIAALCGEQLKRCTLELGGKSAAIILDDADLDNDDRRPHAQRADEQRPGVCGADPHPRLACALRRSRRGTLRRASPARRSATRSTTRRWSARSFAIAQRDRVEGYIAKGKEEGARVVVGGGRPAGFDKGWYVEPTVFADVDNKMTIAQEEIFGPVLVADPLRRRRRRGGDRQRLRLRPVGFGLDLRPAVRCRRRPAGPHRYVRRSTAWAWTSRRPFGGFKQSGVGRELGPEGLEAFLEPKTIVLPAGFEPA